MMAAILIAALVAEPCLMHDPSYQECLETKLVESSMANDHYQAALEESKRLNSALSSENRKLAQEVNKAPDAKLWFFGGFAGGVLLSALLIGLSR